MIAIRCPECGKKAGEVTELRGFVHLTIECKNRSKIGERREKCACFFEFKLPNPQTGSETEPYRAVVRKK